MHQLWKHISVSCYLSSYPKQDLKMMCEQISKKKKNVYCQSQDAKASKFHANSSRMETLKTSWLFINPLRRAMFWFAVTLVQVYQIQTLLVLLGPSMCIISLQNTLILMTNSHCVSGIIYTEPCFSKPLYKFNTLRKMYQCFKQKKC